jgi:protein ImuA
MRSGFKRPVLEALADRIREVEGRGSGGGSGGELPGPDAARGPGSRLTLTDFVVAGRVHECIGLAWSAWPDAGPPPMHVLLDLAARATRPARTPGSASGVLWIGRRCWPYLPLLGGLLPDSLFIDAPDLRTRLWAIDAALRCPGVRVVVGDGSGLDLPASRRLQLAAEAGGSTGLLARPAHERATLSAAATRWLVTPLPAPSSRPRWAIDCLRCKGVRPFTEAPRFVAEWDHAQGLVVTPAALADRTRSPSPEAVRRSPAAGA